MIDCICIDDKNKPDIIPSSLWVEEGKEYIITHVYKMVNMKGIQGVELRGIDISCYIPYNCFRMDRFAFKPEDVEKLIELIKACTGLNDVDIDTLIEELTIKEKEYEF